MSIQQKIIPNQRRIGLTGGIASGKSTIANYISTLKGLPILDADLFSRELLSPNSKEYKKVISHFGNQIVDSSSIENVINRKLLKKIIFDNSEHRKWIQDLLHPLIKEKMIKKCNQLKDEKILVLVIPLLFEAKFTDLCTEIWLVKCSKEIQNKRLMERDQISEKEATKIINIQLDFKKQSRFSDFILDNSDDKNVWINKIKKLI